MNLYIIETLCLFIINTSLAAGELKTWYRASNGFYYKLFNDQVNYATAKSNCQKLGADLASAGVRDSTVRREILPLVKAGNDDTWIGLSKLEGKFIWADGVDSTEDNTDWDADQPDNLGGGEDCVQFWPVDKWQLNNISCNIDMKYICEARA
uniref:lectin-like n=1 Tax=Styela clava TaxID=7725 RepID=UPI0019395F82|nr:lectin-like [Styela clava]